MIYDLNVKLYLCLLHRLLSNKLLLKKLRVNFEILKGNFFCFYLFVFKVVKTMIFYKKRNNKKHHLVIIHIGNYLKIENQNINLFKA